MALAARANAPITSGPRKIEIIADKLYFMWVNEGFDVSAVSKKSLHFTIDKELIYTAFFADFGPLNLGLTYKFCRILHGHMSNQEVSNGSVTFYCSSHEHRKANAAVLLMAYLIFVRGFSVEDAYGPFIGLDPPFSTFRDAAFGINSFPITVLDCARAFHRASINKHFEYATFDIDQFISLNKYENGDISWIIPRKFIAFSGPLSQRRELGNGLFSLLPQEYVPIFHKLGVTCIIRFNNKCYDKKVFTKAGIRHVDLFYEDGGNPTESILQSFLQICEQERGAIAVHCKAGLGRTGTNIAAYMMKHYGYTTKESTAWCRVCRPGSVVGPQQQYLADIEPRMHEEGKRYRQERVTPLPSRVSDQSVPPIGKPPVARPISSTLWAAHIPGTTHQQTGRPLHLPSATDERRPSTGSGRTAVHRSHAYHENGDRGRERSNTDSSGELRRVNSHGGGSGLAKLKNSDQQALSASYDSRASSRPSTGNGAPSSANKLRSSLNGSPYTSGTSRHGTSKLVSRR